MVMARAKFGGWLRACLRNLNAVASKRGRVNRHFPHDASILGPHRLDCDGTVVTKSMRATVEHWIEVTDAGHEAGIVDDGWTDDCERTAVVGKWNGDAASNERSEQSWWNNVDKELGGSITNVAGETESPHHGNAHVAVTQDFEHGVQQRFTLSQPPQHMHNTHAQEIHV